MSLMAMDFHKVMVELNIGCGRTLLQNMTSAKCWILIWTDWVRVMAALWTFSLQNNVINIGPNFLLLMKTYQLM